MSKPIRYEYIRLEPAENGFILCYTEVSKRMGSGEYDSCNHESKQKVYSWDDFDSAAADMKAMVTFNKGSEAGKESALDTERPLQSY